MERDPESRKNERFSPETKCLVYCNTCREVIAEDEGRGVDGALVALAVSSHLNHPNNELTAGMHHDIVTLTMNTHGVHDGIYFGKDVDKM